MNSGNYQWLWETPVTINGQPCPYKYFEDPQDIAHGLSTDGFCPFQKRKKTCWLILIYNYNLSLEICIWIPHILCVGVVPGPYKPKDFDSFLWPLVEELLKLTAGIKAFDLSSDEIFVLCAFLILVFRDIPAVSMVMRMKGHNGLVPCQMCKITALQTPNSHSPGHYVPLHHAQHLTVRNNDMVTHVYDPANLPLCTYADFLDTACAVQMAPTTAQSNIHAKNSGIKGIPILSYLPSLFFPYSFSYDFMHLIFKNVIKNLILLWTGKFKGLDKGTRQYHLMPKVWEAIGTATTASGLIIPYVFGAQPPNFCDDKMACTADTWSFWMLYLGPVLLSKRFQRQVYFDHFIELVKFIHICIQFKISTAKISTLQEGFQNWVLRYKQ
jgi:Transposase family tnp2